MDNNSIIQLEEEFNKMVKGLEYFIRNVNVVYSQLITINTMNKAVEQHSQQATQYFKDYAHPHYYSGLFDMYRGPYPYSYLYPTDNGFNPYQPCPNMPFTNDEILRLKSQSNKYDQFLLIPPGVLTRKEASDLLTKIYGEPDDEDEEEK